MQEKENMTFVDTHNLMSSNALSMFFAFCFLQPNSFEIVREQPYNPDIIMSIQITISIVLQFVAIFWQNKKVVQSLKVDCPPTQPTFATGKALRALPKVCPKRHRPRSDPGGAMCESWLFGRLEGREFLKVFRKVSPFVRLRTQKSFGLGDRHEEWQHGCFNLSFSVILKFVCLKHKKCIFVHLSEKLRRCC